MNCAVDSWHGWALSLISVVVFVLDSCCEGHTVILLPCLVSLALFHCECRVSVDMGLPLLI